MMNGMEEEQKWDEIAHIGMNFDIWDLVSLCNIDNFNLRQSNIEEELGHLQ